MIDDQGSNYILCVSVHSSPKSSFGMHIWLGYVRGFDKTVSSVCMYIIYCQVLHVHDIKLMKTTGPSLLDFCNLSIDAMALCKWVQNTANAWLPYYYTNIVITGKFSN